MSIIQENMFTNLEAKQGLTVALADRDGLRWAQEQVTLHHYLHHPVDARCRPLAYLVQGDGETLGCLIFGRPQATRVNGWYGSVADVKAGRCPLTRWQVLNLARVWLHPSIQRGGEHFIANAATQVIAQALQKVRYDYLLAHPPVFLDEPYEIRECLSYCNTRIHRGTLYLAASFRLLRTNARGLATYTRPLRRLTHAEHAAIVCCSQQSVRARRYRAARQVVQVPLFACEERLSDACSGDQLFFDAYPSLL
jgi:hypothetical protein